MTLLKRAELSAGKRGEGLMYSRRFTDSAPDLPPDYGGVAYRKGQTGKEEKEETEPREPDAAYRGRTDGGPFSGRGMKREPRRRASQERRYPRRPLYEESPVKTEKKHAEKEENEKSGGLLSSLFSLSGRSFSMEDIVLAGLILLMMTDKKGDREPDSELLLILGLLLLSK